jgi:hypothetical protein
MVKILFLVELFELFVKYLCLCSVAFDWQIVVVSLCDEVFELLKHPQLGQPLL